MSTPACCQKGRPRGGPSSRRGMAGAVGMALSGLGLVFLPKCPACVAAWVAVLSGVGLSTAAASWLRHGFMMGCIMGLAIPTLLWLRGRRRLASQHTADERARDPGSGP